LWIDMKPKNFVTRLLTRLFGRREGENVPIRELTPELATTQLPGPFDFSIGLGYYSMQTFHRRTHMGTLIHLMKYQYSREAAERLAVFLIDYLTKHPLPYRPDLIVTVPDSIPNRPFSPVGHIAERVAEKFGWTARQDIIVRARLEKPQKDRSFEERLADNRARYALRYPEAVRGKTVLLFDDIFATGKSFIEAAELIRERDPIRLMGLTLVKLGRA
jgi:predicted amidophosphoribosyltransferase